MISPSDPQGSQGNQGNHSGGYITYSYSDKKGNTKNDNNEPRGQNWLQPVLTWAGNGIDLSRYGASGIVAKSPMPVEKLGSFFKWGMYAGVGTAYLGAANAGIDWGNGRYLDGSVNMFMAINSAVGACVPVWTIPSVLVNAGVQTGYPHLRSLIDRNTKNPVIRNALGLD